MRRYFTAEVGGFLVVLGAVLSTGTAHAGANANASIQLHLLSPTTKAQCTRAAITPPCHQIVTEGDLYPAVYFAHVLVTDGSAAAGVGGLQFGIQYDGPGASDGVGVDIYSWTLCATLEFITPPNPAWPNSGSGTLITWNSTTQCQRFEPFGAGTGVVANAGYFYMAAYTDAAFSIIPRPVDGFAKIADCNAVEDIIDGFQLGSAGFGSRQGFSPCGIQEPPLYCNVLGPSTVITGTAGHVYTVEFAPDPALYPRTWSITGNGTLTSPHPDSAIVTAGDPGSYEVRVTIPSYGGMTCARQVTVEMHTPTLPTTWSGIKALSR